MRILVVEDDTQISAFIAKGLREAGLPQGGTECG